jgi:hypothetical protein
VQTRVKRLTMHRNNQDTETSKTTRQSLMIQLPQSPEPDTRITAEYCLCSLHRYIVYNLQSVIMENSICGGGIHV